MSNAIEPIDGDLENKEIIMWQNYLQPTSLEGALELLEQYAGKARIVAGGTDVLVELQRGVKPTATLIDITALRDLKYMREENRYILLGALTTHNDVIASSTCVQYALPLAQACWVVGAPQIRNRGTIVGNLMTASPANDTITALMALGAELVLVRRGSERIVALENFYPGFRQTVLQSDELIREIRIPAMQSNQRGMFVRLGLRRAQAISVIDFAIILTFDEETIIDARITLGSVAPTIVHAHTVETYLQGKALDEAVCREAGQLTVNDASPIGDVRGSATYRQATLGVLVTQALQQIAAGKQAEGWMAQPVLLDANTELDEAKLESTPPSGPFAGTIATVINGKPYLIANSQWKTLLNMLREDAGLTGTKEGCAEGECGACTVWLNGQAVMSCLVPAVQAHNGRITTIEGLSAEGEAQGAAYGGELHPLQQAFIDCGAVQCGFCIPGMLMAGAKLLQELPHPNLDETLVALSGNICRCTGYRKILDAVAQAAQPAKGGQA
ncbi:MAG: 2Fe-2S iron-sulfur cluster binding domain-containing protein [Chloroflexi bacterium]|nr:MAG: 2Fe-2S iron-sulfur cluster binding domain-containing protein [Chloroflexota bacterium]